MFVYTDSAIHCVYLTDQCTCKVFMKVADGTKEASHTYTRMVSPPISSYIQQHEFHGMLAKSHADYGLLFIGQCVVFLYPLRLE